MSEEIPESMSAELGAWNHGSGIPLETWIENTGNFRLAVGYSTIFWPQFEAVGKYVLVSGVSVETVTEWENSPNTLERDLEAAINHIHLADMHMHDVQDISADKLLCLGNTLKEIYEAKLQWQFPDRAFTVIFIVPEDAEDFQDYQITFWQKKWEKSEQD